MIRAVVDPDCVPGWRGAEDPHAEDPTDEYDQDRYHREGSYESDHAAGAYQDELEPESARPRGGDR